MFEVVKRVKEVGELKSERSAVGNGRKLLPRRVFFTKGVGVGESEEESLKRALIDAKIGDFNLVPVSSIYPPHCEMIYLDEGLSELKPGQIVFCVLSKMTSCEEGERIYASVGVAVPKDRSLNGYLTEYHGYGSEDHAERMARYMLETAFGVRDVESFSVRAEATVEKFTTVLAAAVFVTEILNR